MSNRIKPEVLAPAGDFERLQAAVKYGADAVYLGATSFGMRANAGNFNEEELRAGVKFAHEHGVRVYLTCNILPTNEEADQLEEFLLRAADAGVDALIVADVGILMMARRLVPQIDIHISTQTGVVNYLTANELYKLGAKRVVLARELSLETIREIRRRDPCGPGDRMLCAWRHVHVLLGTVPALQLPHRTGRQPGRMCPALPLELLSHGGEASGTVFPHL